MSDKTLKELGDIIKALKLKRRGLTAGKGFQLPGIGCSIDKMHILSIIKKRRESNG
jgi:hypothetical protein